VAPDLGSVGFGLTGSPDGRTIVCEANVTHEPVNTGCSPVRVIEVELK
jgi:hypothetical protein